ncbi:MAG: VWA domain-containing protein [Desulfosarcinaceae bacterium]|nr:VWA domain-containing protein [Desulfosarcinaceae bacterium]
MFRFASPTALLLLGLLPLMVWWRSRQPGAALDHSGLTAVVGLRPTLAVRLCRVLPWLKWLALVLMVVALARPQWGVRQTTILSEGINIVLAVDLSESMAALDFKAEGKVVNRLAAVKAVVAEFIASRAAERSGDRIGMVVFGSQAYTQLPLTRDYDTLLRVLDRLEIGAAGKSTAIGDALGISVKRLADIASEANLIVLLTDGRSNSGSLSPQAAAQAAKAKGVKVYTIGVGSRGKVPFRVQSPLFGERIVYQRVDIDENALAAIAAATDGLYFRAEDTEGLRKIYATIDEMETTEVELKTYDQYNDLYRYLLLPALCVLILWTVLVNTRFLEVP